MFVCWAAEVEEERQLEKVGGKLGLMRRMRVLRAAMEMMKDEMGGRLRMKREGIKVVLRWQRNSASKMFDGWRENAAQKRERARRGLAVVQRWRNGVTAKGFLSWLDCVAEAKMSRKGDAWSTLLARRTARSVLSNVFGCWTAYHAEHASLLASCLRTMQAHKTALTAAAVEVWNRQVASAKRVRMLCWSIATRLMMRSERHAFDQWRSSHDHTVALTRKGVALIEQLLHSLQHRAFSALVCNGAEQRSDRSKAQAAAKVWSCPIPEPLRPNHLEFGVPALEAKRAASAQSSSHGPDVGSEVEAKRAGDQLSVLGHADTRQPSQSKAAVTSLRKAHEPIAASCIQHVERKDATAGRHGTADREGGASVGAWDA
eukprot:2826051-Rhodomonas_salina.5